MRKLWIFLVGLSISLGVLAIAFATHHIVFAQTADQTAQRAEWETELQQTEAEIAQWQATLDASEKNTASLKNDAAILTAKINQAKAFIQQKNIQIAQLDQSIDDKTQTISSLQDQINTSDASIADLLRKTAELDNYDIAEVILSKQDISDFFLDLDSYGTIDRSLETLLGQVRDNQSLTEAQKEQLSEQKDQQTDLAQSMQQQESQVATDEQQKQALIAANESDQETYQQIIADREAKAAQIKAELFNLAGGTSAIAFGDAYTYAQAAQKATGIDPAFLLAILTQESNLGANVGKCYLTNTTTGAGVSTTGTVWPNLMKPSRDVQPFLDITGALGLDPMKTVVSCPIAGVGGYGGAMGPAQFIPSTWQLIASRVESALGESMANPWNAQDAFMASALYLSDLGGSGGSYSAEIKAACKYYGSGGSSCSYGKSVMSKASDIQTNMIDPLTIQE